MRIEPITGTVGAEISGMDLSQPLGPQEKGAVRAALADHGVVFFRGQRLTVQQQKDFAQAFGPLFVHPSFRTAQDPEVVEVRREPGDTRLVGEEWHADTTMMPAPPMGAVLYAVEVPPYGGDTLFANQAAAWDALSASMKAMLRPLRAIHSDMKVAGPAARAAFNAGRATKLKDDPHWRETRTSHPVVCVHPHSGREYLFVNASYTTHFDGMTLDESRPLMEFLFAHGHRPEFTCRFRWQPGSVAFWDNRLTQHLAVGDAGRFLRVMRRVQISGQVPRSAIEPAR